MGGWTGESITLPIGGAWTYKLRLEHQTSAQSNLVFGRKLFNTEQEAKAAGDAHLKDEIEKRSKRRHARRRAGKQE